MTKKQTKKGLTSSQFLLFSCYRCSVLQGVLEVVLEVITPEAELTPARAGILLYIHILSLWEQACMRNDYEHKRKLKI